MQGHLSQNCQQRVEELTSTKRLPGTLILVSLNYTSVAYC